MFLEFIMMFLLSSFCFTLISLASSTFFNLGFFGNGLVGMVFIFVFLVFWWLVDKLSYRKYLNDLQTTDCECEYDFSNPPAFMSGTRGKIAGGIREINHCNVDGISLHRTVLKNNDVDEEDMRPAS